MQKEKVSVLNDKMQGIFETIKRVIIGALLDSYVYFLFEDKINLDDLAMQILFECCKYAYDSTSKKNSLRSYMDSPELDDERMRYQRTVQKINDYRKKEYLMQKELSGIELDGLLPTKMEDIQEKIEGYQFNEFQYWEIKNVHDMRLVSLIADNRILSKKVFGKCPNCGKDVVNGKYGAYCVGKCGMNVNRVMGKVLTEEQVKNLLAGKKILLKGLTSKAGKKYDAYIIPEGTEEYSYTKDGEVKSGVQYKFTMEFLDRKCGANRKYRV